MNRSLGRLAAIAIGAIFMVGGVDAAPESQTVRFSIAVSGGASKGAYEAGLNWAVLKIVRGSSHLEDLGGGQFRPLEVASVAGASAGGINTILTGLAWCTRPEAEGGIPNRVDSNVFYDIWLRMDINALLPPDADSESYLPGDALFSRRDYFAAADDLREQWRRPAFRVGCKVPMGVTVTRVEPQALMVGDIEVKNQRFYIPFELRVKEDGSVGYYFDPTDYPRISDPAMILMPRPRSAPEFSISDEYIIEAAAATSAFPTALGRRRLQYCRLMVRSETVPPGSDAELSDTDLVCPQGYELDEAEFADGGLFDNLPIGLARTLAEAHVDAVNDPIPVTYFYIDPDRVRFDSPDPPDNAACDSNDPPEACRVMEFSFFTESSLLVGAIGAARKYELYRETTSDFWQLNLSRLSYELAQILEEQHSDVDCREQLPFFDPPLACADAVRRSGRFLEIVYDRTRPAITPPYSSDLLVKAGVADDCAQSSHGSDVEPRIECRIDMQRFRNQLAEALMSIIDAAQIADQRLYVGISRSRQSIHNDRALRVSSRGGPITGTLLGDFGSFLDYKFREYDYYVGVYDAIAIISRTLCALSYPPEKQPEDYRRCVDLLGSQLYDAIGVDDSARARYVFASLAEREFGKNGLFSFANSPPPPVDRDMQIIHDGLQLALESGEEHSDDQPNVFVTENSFFETLHAKNFVPTKTKDGAEPLLAEIIVDPELWSTELTRRFTARLVYLERAAADIYAAREPNPDLREKSYVPLMGATSHLLQSMTYRYPDFTFSPSTAAEDWIWRYVIPYELSFDLVEGDILVAWQPTLALSQKNLLNVRASLGFAGGIFNSSASRDRENYFGLGVGYIRRTGSSAISSFGFTPTWYHAWTKPTVGSQDTPGGDISVGFISDRLRVGVGTRDVRNFGDNWFLTLGITDLPGATYWLTR